MRGLVVGAQAPGQSWRLRRLVGLYRGSLDADVRPNVIRPNLITILLALTSAVAASAEPLCSLPLEGGGQEGSWRIQRGFTEEAARTELTKLEALLGPDGEAVDRVAWETSSYTSKVGISSAWHRRQSNAVSQSHSFPNFVRLCVIAPTCDIRPNNAWSSP